MSQLEKLEFDSSPKFAANGMFPYALPPEELRDHLNSESSRWSAGIKPSMISAARLAARLAVVTLGGSR